MPLTHQKISQIKGPRIYLRNPRFPHRQILIAALGVALLPLAHATAQSAPRQDSAAAKELTARVGPPSQQAIDEFKKAGMEDVKPHTLTAEERAKIEAALASLPALNRRVLEKKLHQLAFVDGIPGEGTGLTSPAGETGLYDITLRASIVDESLATFLTTKERRVFSEDASGNTVTVNATGTSALTYVLLHESTHVVDKSCGITSQAGNRLDAGIWTGPRDLAPRWASSILATNFFRTGHALEIGKAPAVYDALAQSPFVSLYATASAQEDFAELVAWREVQKQHHGKLAVELTDAGGNILRRWRPLRFPEVRKRFREVDRLLASPGSCSAVS